MTYSRATVILPGFAKMIGAWYMGRFSKDVEGIKWAAEQLGISSTTAYRLAEAGELAGAFRVGGQWRISVIAFEREIHKDRVAS